ncbi:MAG: hypothetical protein ACKO24_12200 [Leptolyngbyaceae cyanobacterium]
MGRVRLTGGGYAKRPFSKSKRSQKSPPKNEFFNVGGNLTIFSDYAILHEKEPTGALTGKIYRINLDSLRSKLPKKYKNSKKLEVICTLGIRLEPDSKEKNSDNSQQESVYRVSRIHYATDNQKVKNNSAGTNEDASNPLAENNNLSTLNNQLEPSDINSQDIKSFEIYRQLVFEYVGNKGEAERKVSDHIQSCIGGVRELVTPDGDRVDLITSDILVEVKAATDWDNSVGQILKYKIHYPNHKPVIFLFDDGLSCEVAKSRLLQVIKKYINIDIYVVSSIDELQRIIH